jgi:putative hydrolase of the HAD superfamily
VLFDAAGTLFTTRASVGEIYAGFARHYGSQAEPNAIQAAFTRHFRGDGPLSVQDQKRWWKDVVYRVFNEVGMVEDFDEFFDRVYDNFRDSQGWVLFPETLDVLKQLTRLGLKLGIISNFDTRIYSVLESLKIRHFFDAVTISSEAGYSKPSREIFASAMRALGVPAPEILVVGDSPHDDVQGAMVAGLSAILLDRNNRYAARSDLRRVSSLKEVIPEVVGLESPLDDLDV